MKQAIITYNGAVFLTDSGSARNTFGDSIPGRRVVQREKIMKKILIGMVAVAVFLCCMVTQSYGVIYFEDCFNYTNHTAFQNSTWSVGGNAQLQNSGGAVDNGKCFNIAYINGGTGPNQVQKQLGDSYPEGYLRFYAKLTNKQSSFPKFLKFFGSNCCASGYSNWTAGRPSYTSAALRGITHGGGNSTGDSNCPVRFDTGNIPCDGGNMEVYSGSIWKFNDENWHKFIFYWKLNTNGNADGVFGIWIDGVQVMYATGLINRSSSNPRSFQRFTLGDYVDASANSVPTYYVWYDELVLASTYEEANNGGTSCGGTSCGGNAPSLSSSSSPDNCGNADGTATVSPTGGSGSYTYQWSNGATSLTAGGLAAGNYTITVTDTDGCSATDNVAVGYTACYSGICLEGEDGTLASPAESVADATVSQNAYMQTTAGESGTVAYTFNVDTPGTYKLTARVYAAGDGNDSWYFYFDNETEDVWDFNPTADPSLFGVWYHDELAKRGTGTFDNPEKDPYLIYLTQGSHTLNLRGREANAKLDYFCLEKQITTGTEDVEGTAGIVVYPNPTTGELRITNDELRMKNGDFGLMTFDLRLYDLYGRVVLENQLPATNYQLLDLSHLPAGVYFLSVTTGNGTVTEKVVKY